MASTNNAQAGPSSMLPKESTKLEFAGKVQIYESSTLENCIDYSILVSNDISMARDQLANERNWLTWFRLSCTLIILGFTIFLQFRLPDGTTPEQEPSNDSNQPIAYIFCVLGICCSFVGLAKYFKNQRLLVKQATYVQAGWGSYIMIAILFLFVCTIMILASVKSSGTFST